ncbi:MAG: MFS transporter [Acidimicrobiales bacterium]
MVTPGFLLIMAATFAYFLGIGALLPTVPRYTAGPLGGGSLAVGVVVGSLSLTAVVLRPWAGWVADRRGRRLLMVAGAALVGVSVASYVVARSLAVLVPLRLVTGAGEALFFVGAASAINDIAPDARRGEATSYFSLSLYGGLAAGPAIGELVLAGGRYGAVWLVAAGGALVSALLAAGVREPRPTEPTPSPSRRLVHPASLPARDRAPGQRVGPGCLHRLRAALRP